MITAVQISGSQRAAARMPAAQVSDKALGILLASLFPALFWTAMIAIAGSAMGHSLSVATLATVGGSIATFLAVVVGSLVARRA